MLSSRILKFINLSIAILALLLLVAAYWIAWRPLPKVSGRMEAPVAQKATVKRDGYGVPHIQAASLEDAIFLQGYVTAQDRMWQMDALRRVAAGEISELIGSGGLDIDREARRLRMRRVAEEQAARLPAGDRAVLAAYARGVNFYLEQNRGKYGLEFALMRYDPRPWTVVDSVLAGLQMFQTLTTSWREDLQKQALQEGGDRAKVEYLLPPRLRWGPAPGSNAWAVSGGRTESGRPVLANDPHLEFTLPSTWYMTHLKTEGLNVSGVSLPGLPCIIIGHNGRVAWGMTNLHFDVQDLYREQLDERSGRYTFRGQVMQARPESDVIQVKGEKPVPLRIWVTQHGPVFSHEGAFYAIRWAAAEAGNFEFPFVEINRSGNWNDFNTALRRFTGPAQNFVYADVDGNIGYRVAGRLPVRKDFTGDVPVDGASGKFEWEGYIPFDDLPRAYNPPDGLIVTANQNPFPHDFPYRVSGNFAADYRARQIRNLLAGRGKWKPGDMLAVQKDVYSGFSHFLAKQTVAAYDRKKPAGQELAAAVGVLRDWDGQMDKDSGAAMVCELLYRALRRSVAEHVALKKGELFEPQISHAVIERLLRERPVGWFTDWEAWLVQNLTAAIDEGARFQGSNAARWRLGVWNPLAIPNPVAGRIPVIGKYFGIGPVAMSGSSTSVKQTTRRLGPSMRMVVDLADLDNSLQNITIGQSGHFLSSHYKDQWRRYYYGESLRMQFGKVEAESELEVVPGR